MKALLIGLGLLWTVPSPAGEPWWNKDWKFRRPVTILNRGERALEKGFTMQIDVDPDYLLLRDKSKAGFEDWALVRGGERVPLLLQPGSAAGQGAARPGLRSLGGLLPSRSPGRALPGGQGPDGLRQGRRARDPRGRQRPHRLLARADGVPE